MSNVNRISVKIEVVKDDFEGDSDPDINLVENTFRKALDQIGYTYDNVTDKFFTIRFDETPDGGIAATVSAAEKRDN